MSRAVYVTSMQNRHTNHTHTYIHKERKEKDRQTPDYYLLPVQQTCTFNRFWVPSSYTHRTHPKFNVLYKISSSLPRARSLPSVGARTWHQMTDRLLETSGIQPHHHGKVFSVFDLAGQSSHQDGVMLGFPASLKLLRTLKQLPHHNHLDDPVKKLCLAEQSNGETGRDNSFLKFETGPARALDSVPGQRSWRLRAQSAETPFWEN